MTQQTHTRRIFRKSKRRERQPAPVLASHPHEPETESILNGKGETLHDPLPHHQAEQLQGLHLSSGQRQAVALEIARTQGNRSLSSLIQPSLDQARPTRNTALQRQQAPASAGANPGGQGSGKVQGAEEKFYDVTGAKLNDLLPQLNRLKNFAADTETEIGCDAQPTRLPNGQWQAILHWRVTKATTTLPRWVNYDTANAAAQNEWDRYLGQVRQHEQTKHIEVVGDFLTKLAPPYTTITTAKQGELRAKITALFEKIKNQIQTQLHDGCGNGVEIDAILHARRDQSK